MTGTTTPQVDLNYDFTAVGFELHPRTGQLFACSYQVKKRSNTGVKIGPSKSRPTDATISNKCTTPDNAHYGDAWTGKHARADGEDKGLATKAPLACLSIGASREAGSPWACHGASSMPTSHNCQAIAYYH